MYIFNSMYKHCTILQIWVLSGYCKTIFFRPVNALFSKIGRLAYEDVFLHLVNSKCMPILLYSLEVCPLNKADIRSLNFTVTRFLMKLFRTCNTEIIKDCCTYFCFKLPSELIPGRSEKFLNKLQRYSSCVRLNEGAICICICIAFVFVFLYVFLIIVSAFVQTNLWKTVYS